MRIKIFEAFVISLFLNFLASAQSVKEKSYIISKEDFYTIDLKSNKVLITLNSKERKWVGDKDDSSVKANRINYIDSFEQISNIDAYVITPEGKKEKVRDVFTEDMEIKNVFYHDMKYKYYYFHDLKNGSETYSAFLF
jgi:hypothetical protein